MNSPVNSLTGEFIGEFTAGELLFTGLKKNSPVTFDNSPFGSTNGQNTYISIFLGISVSMLSRDFYNIPDLPEEDLSLS